MDKIIGQKITNELKRRRQNDPNSIDILNGQAMYDDFVESGLESLSDFFPFNEAMSVGPVDSQVFSRDFIRARSDYHDINIQKYEKITVKTLDIFLAGNYSSIGLWFGSDMFCQINLLTLLAYLDQISYGGQVFFYKINEENYDFEITEIDPKGYKTAYEKLLISKEKLAGKLIDTILKASDIYLGLERDDNMLRNYIRDNSWKKEEDLIGELLLCFKEIGYGDLQYKKLINTMIEK